MSTEIESISNKREIDRGKTHSGFEILVAANAVAASSNLSVFEQTHSFDNLVQTFAYCEEKSASVYEKIVK